jgi:hypothetical protein
MIINNIHINKVTISMKGFIEMTEVYKIMMENPNLEFSIKYVRATNRGSLQKGSIKEVRLGLSPNVRKMAKGLVVTINKDSKRKYLHKDKWTLALYNYNKQRPESPLYSHVIEFEGQVVKH